MNDDGCLRLFLTFITSYIIFFLVWSGRAGVLSALQIVYSYFEKGCRKNVHATIPKGNMGYDQYTVSDDCTCRTYFCCFPLALANTFPQPFVTILSNFFKNSELKTTHNAFRDCRVHFFPQPFSK